MAERRKTVLLLLGMLAWVGAGFLGAVAVAAVLGFTSGVARGLLHAGGDAWPDRLTYVLVGATGFQGMLLLGAWYQGRRAGNGDWRAGLGIRPVEHKGAIALLCAAMLGWLMVFMLLMASFPALREFARSVTPEVLFGANTDSTSAVVLRFALVALLAPVSEEFFFRGWLWEALRRRGHPAAITAGITATPWLLLHGIDSPSRILLLIPAAIVFSLARHVGGSVKASLAVHLTNNGTAVLLQALATALGHSA